MASSLYTARPVYLRIGIISWSTMTLFAYRLMLSPILDMFLIQRTCVLGGVVNLTYNDINCICSEFQKYITIIGMNVWLSTWTFSCSLTPSGWHLRPILVKNCCFEICTQMRNRVRLETF